MEQLTQKLKRLLRIPVIAVCALAIVLIAVWAALALWYRLPVPMGARGIAAGMIGSLGVVTAVALFSRFRLRLLIVFLLAFGSILVWWQTIKPENRADWAPDVARQVTGTLDGNLLTLTNVRDFAWRSDADFTARWTTRTYDLSKLQTLDLFMSYWAGPEMAHVIMSFGFDNGDYLPWSIEVKRLAGGEFSPLADLFKTDPLVIVASDERDVVGVRAVVRGEDVQLYRLKTPPDDARKLLLEYVADANALAAKPEFYNSITTNCTTVIVKMMRAVGAVVPFDWRFIVNGYLPSYAYDHGALDSRMTLAELKALSHIDKRARAAWHSPDFSRLIRVGVPSPGIPLHNTSEAGGD
jgi:hypothetical protein